MKKILFAGLLGLAMLAPINNAKAAIHPLAKIVSTNLDGWIVTITSDSGSDPIQRITVFDSSGEELYMLECYGYVATINLSSWGSGDYKLQIVTQKGVTNTDVQLP